MLDSTTSLNDVIRPRQYRGRDREPEGLRGREVDHELELRNLLHGKVCRLRTPENLVHVDGRAPPILLGVWVVAHQTAGLHEEPSLAHCRQPVRNGQFGDALSSGYEGYGAEYEHGLRAASGH